MILGSAALLSILSASAQAPSPLTPPAVDNRLRADVSFGLGPIIDRMKPDSSAATLVPGFFANLGLAGRSFGADLGLTGIVRAAADEAPSRNVVSLSLLWRPLGTRRLEDPGFAERVLRSLTFAAGPAYESLDKAAVKGAARIGLRGGVRIDLPLEGTGRSETRLRIAGQRIWGLTSAAFAERPVGDSFAEIAVLLAFLM